MSYILHTDKSWHQTQQDLALCFERWGVAEWTTNYPRGARLSGVNQSDTDKTVTLSYTKDGKQVNLQMNKQDRAIDNLRVLYLAVEAMRLNEKRGLAEVLESAYLQLEAPKRRNPYEVLGIRSDSTLEIAEAVFRTLARKYHPDSKPEGDVEKFKEVNEAIEAIREDKKHE